MAFSGIEWIIVIVAIVLLLFGAKKIPELARGLGKARAEYTRGQMMVEKEIREAKRAEREAEEREKEEKKKKKRDEEKGEKEKDEKEEAEEDEDEEDLSELQKAAKNLGIKPEGKTDEELKVLIKYKLEED